MAGIELPKTQHFKPPGFREVDPQSIQRACRKDEDIINADQLKERPHSVNWEDVYFCDEFHFGVGTQTTRRIKRRRGRKSRDKASNVHRKKVTSKDTKAKAREEDYLKLINVFCIVGKNYRRAIAYEVPNSVGKMTSKVYIDILDQLRGDLQGITLWQDKDSAHDSKATTDWAKKHGIKLLTSPGNSPDLSIIESMAHPIKKKFHSRRCASQSVALERFREVFREYTD
ncbi:uncharacterized protein PAC_18608 [Phialocephala subalpina]|uniref:Tc1-like transposase DDE domain-containing protein n=1 Tax=Phialocephala subalpina TaxID=576137 RepID=A0A1L7XUK5_9HELO|nr:uncharacterized protein PAC_18608 [Phialocephala subalpina]